MVNRPPAVAGSFYSDNPVVLRREIETLLARAEVPEGLAAPPIGLISPHAGYLYSGAVAAAAFRLVRDRAAEYDLVVVVSPSHHHYFPGFSLYAAGNYETPLGEVAVDQALAEALIAAHDEVHFVAEAHRREHALEVQLPFLQVALGDFTLLPVVMGQQSWPQAEKLAEILFDLGRQRRLLLVASSDLSHFHPAARAEALDRKIVEAVSGFDAAGLWAAIETGRAEACGAGPMLAVMLAARRLGARRAEILSYRHSGAVSGDYSQVVGYLAAAFFQA